MPKFPRYYKWDPLRDWNKIELKLAHLNMPISGARSVLLARMNRACKAGQSTPKGSKCGEELTNQRDLRSGQRAERDQDGDEGVVSAPR